jgi:hypothetical protein
LLLDIVTGVPPDGAAAIRYTLQEVLEPPFRELGLQISEETPGCTTEAGVRPSEKVREIPLSAAVKITEVLAVTADGEVAVKVWDVVPDATVTEAGTETRAEFPLASATTVELEGAAVRLTVQVAEEGGVRLAGAQVKVESAGGPPPEAGVRPSEKVREIPLSAAVKITEVLAVTADGEVAVKVWDVAPDATVSEAGTETRAELPLASATTVELEGAAVKLTVQVAEEGGTRLAGAHVKLDSAGGPPPEG